MVRFEKPDCPVWRLSRAGPDFCSGLCPRLRNPILLCCHLIWTFLRVGLCFAIGQRLAPRPCPPLTALWLIGRGSILQCFLLMPVISSCSYFLGNRTIQFGVPDHPVFLSRNPAVLLVANVSVTVISCVVASIAKTLRRSWPSWVEGHRQQNP
jgi:hypothetical protein